MAKVTATAANFRDTFRAYAAESSNMRDHPLMSASITYVCENDDAAAVLRDDAAQDAADMAADIAAADSTSELGEQAEVAGDIFAAASVDESVPEGAITQADGVAREVATANDMSVDELLPEITEVDRVAMVPATESSNGRITWRPMYSRIRQDKPALMRCAESMWTSAKALFSNAWDAILKAFRKFAQWVDKYIGTFPRLKSKVDSLLKDARALDGKKIKSGENKIEVTSGVKNLAVPGDSNSDVTYITKGAELVSTVTNLRKAVEGTVEIQRSVEEGANDIVDSLNSTDFSDNESAEKSANDLISACKGMVQGLVDKAKSGSRMADHDSAYAEAYSVKAIPGYQRVLVMVPKKDAFDKAVIKSDGVVIDEFTDAINGLDFKVVDGDPKLKKTVKDSVQFETMTSGQIEELANELRKGLEEIIAYRSSKQYLKNEASVRKLKSSIEKMDSRRTNSSSEDASKYSRSVGKYAVAVGRALMRTLQAPTRNITFFDTYTNFCVGLARKCLATYEAR